MCFKAPKTAEIERGLDSLMGSDLHFPHKTLGGEAFTKLPKVNKTFYFSKKKQKNRRFYRNRLTSEAQANKTHFN